MKKYLKPEVDMVDIKMTAGITGAEVVEERGGKCSCCGKKWTGLSDNSSHKGWCLAVGGPGYPGNETNSNS